MRFGKKPWFFDPGQLFASTNLIPIEGTSRTEQLNTVTRLILVVGILFYLCDFGACGLFGGLVILLAILYYLSQRPLMESYSLLVKPDEVDEVGAHWTLKHGRPNPKTRVPPVIAPHSHDLNVWGRSESVHSHVNGNKVEYLVNEVEDNWSLPDPIYHHPHKFASQLDYNRRFEYPWHPQQVTSRMKGGFQGKEFFTGRGSQSASLTDRGSIASRDPLPQNYFEKRDRLDRLSGQTSTELMESFVPESHLRRGNLPSTLSATGRDERFQESHRFHHRTTESNPHLQLQHQTIEPINDNIGTSFLPQYTKVDDELGSTFVDHYTYSRWDPQLVRNEEDLSPGRAMEQPIRTRWSQKMSNWEAPPGSIPIEQIYDPRFTGYGDGQRAYEDLNGRIRYNYRSVDAYKHPVFITKSSVDHIDEYTPGGEVWARYDRTVDDRDYRQLAEDRFMEDQIKHREDLIAHQLRPQLRREYQLRMAPLHRGMQGHQLI